MHIVLISTSRHTYFTAKKPTDRHDPLPSDVTKMSRIVGIDPTVEQLVDELETNCTTYSVICTNWQKLARKLQVKEHVIKSLNLDFMSHREDYSGVLMEVLNKWVGEKGNDATMDVLTDALTRAGMKAIADFLSTTYSGVQPTTTTSAPANQPVPSQCGAASQEEVPATTTTTSAPTNQSGCAQDELQRRRINHIAENKPELMRLTTLTDTVLATLRARRVLHEADLAELDAISNALSKKRVFYDLMERRIDKYDTLVQVMEETFQDQVAQLLRRA